MPQTRAMARSSKPGPVPCVTPGAEVELGGHNLERISRSAAVVVAPGVPPDVPPLETARRAGLDIHAEVDVGFVALRGTRCIGITGTNGKTTTTSLISHVLASAGLRAETAGNIGRPLCEVARSDSSSRLARARTIVISTARCTEPEARHGRSHQSGSQSSRPIRHSGSITTAIRLCCSAMRMPPPSGSPMPTTPP